MHPEYRLHFYGKTFSSLKEMARSAHGIQDFIKCSRNYQLPPTADRALEPSLAWYPARDIRTGEFNCDQPTDLKLKFPSIDPYSYFHFAKRNSNHSKARDDTNPDKVSVVLP